MIFTKDGYYQSRIRSNELAVKLRAGIANEDEEFEFSARDRAENDFKRANPHEFKKWTGDKSCDELGLMP